MKTNVCALSLLTCAWLSGLVGAAEKPSVVTIIKKDKGYQMLRNGQPYFAKGVCGSSRLDELVAAGGNSIRAYGSGNLDQAQRRGADRPGRAAAAPIARASTMATRRPSPSRPSGSPGSGQGQGPPGPADVGLGNELELGVPARIAIKIWKALNEIAEGGQARPTPTTR